MVDFVSQADIDALETGIDQALGRIENLLDLEAFAEDIPIIGEQLGTAFEAGQGMLTTLTNLKSAIIDALNTVNDIETVAADQVQSRIQNAIDQKLAALGGAYAGLVTVNVAGGDVSLSLGRQGSQNTSFTLGDLGMSGLGLNMSGQGQAALDYDFGFKVGVDGAGFYLDTSQSHLDFGADLSLNNLSASTTMGFLKFEASNIDDNVPTASADTANFDFSTSWNGSGLVRSFTGDLLNVSVSGGVDLDLHLAANMGDAALPSINSDLHVNWSFNQNLLNGTGANSWGGAQVTFDNVEYDFGSFVEDFVTPILEKLDPILEPINQALSVMKTDLGGILPSDWKAMLDVTGSLDGTADGKVTVLDLIKLANPAITTGDLAGIAQLIDVVDKIVDFVEFFRGRDFADEGYALGDYSVYLNQVQGAANTLANLDIDTGTFTGSGIDLNSFLGGLEGLGLAGFGDTHSGSESNGQSGSDLLGQLISNPMLSFPLLENPLSGIQLLLGQNVDLFHFDLPTINLSAGFDSSGNVTSPINIATLPILPVPLVTAQVNVAFQAIIDLAFGYDTTGLQQYAAGGFTDFTTIFNGFYLDDQRSGGVDTPEAIFRAAVDIIVDANFLGVSIGGGGNIIGEVVLDFADSLFGDDGRLYVNEITFDLAANPFFLFDVEGRITAGLRAYVNAPWGNVWRWNSERLLLADFSFTQGAEDAGPPPGLGDQSGGDLLVNIGTRAGERDIGDTVDYGERVEVSTGAGGKVVISGFGRAQLFGESQAVDRILAAGNAGSDEILLDTNVTAAAELSGGAGSDTLAGGQGNDSLSGGDQDDWLLGREGGDTLRGESGNDYLEGGDGGDVIDGGDGEWDVASYINSTAGVAVNLTSGVHTGFAAGDTFIGIEILEGSNHDDDFVGANGRDIFVGLDGADSLRGVGGDDVLLGGKGADAIEGGDGYDIANYYAAEEGITVTFSGTTGSGSAGEAAGDTLTGIEQVGGSRHADSMTGGEGRQIFLGDAGNDDLDGGAGDDVLAGGLGADALTGGEGTDEATYEFAEAGVALNLVSGGTGGESAGDTFSGIENVRGSAHNDSITGSEVGNSLAGGAGDDTLQGGGGSDILDGGAGGDSLQGGADRDMASYLSATSGIVLDLVNGTRGGDAVGDSFSSIEVLGGSQHGDFIRGTNSLAIDTPDLEEIRGYDGDDSLYGAAGDDTIIGGDGNDQIDGEGDDDTLQGSQGNDTLKGNSGDDVLHGGAGWDAIDGGAGRDRVTYFDSASGVFLNLSTLYREFAGVGVTALASTDGNAAMDVIAAGGDGRSNVEDATGSIHADVLVAFEGGSRLEGLSGNDRLVGLEGTDTLNGGAGADNIDGGAGSDDTATYEDDAVRAGGVGAIISLTSGTGTDGSGSTDTLAGIENLIGSAHDDTLTGNAVMNRLTGGRGADTLNGAGGADIMAGGQGDDVYTVNIVSAAGGAADLVTELSSEGSDLVRTSVNHAGVLEANVEDLQLLNAVLLGTGNDLANRLIGNAANNVLDGGRGGDTFWGYAGDDTYVFDDFGDSLGVVDAHRSGLTGNGESEGGGIDTILLRTANLIPAGTSTTYSLDVAWAQWVENLELQDDDRNISLTGNARDNRLVGNAHSQTLLGGLGNDVINPEVGRDTVDGGAGNDTLELDWSAVTTYDITASDLGGDLAGGYAGTIRNWYDYSDRNRVDFSGIEHFHVKLGQLSDYLHTGDGEDQVWGLDGNDHLSTGRGVDIVDGGTGIDRWEADKSLDAAGATITQAINVDLTQSVQSTYLGTGTVSGIEALTLSTGAGADTIVTLGDFLTDRLDTGAGSDRVTLAGGKDTVAMGANSATGDLLILDWSAVTAYDITYSTLVGTLAEGYAGQLSNWYDYGDRNRVDFSGVEHFQIRLGQLSDYLNTGDGNDTIWGNDGDDTMRTGRGADVIIGGTGIDRWQADKSDATADMTIDLAATLSSYTIGTRTGSVRQVEALGHSDTVGDRFAAGSGNDIVVTYRAFLHDYIETNAGDDRIEIWGGKDVILAGAGTDTLVVDWSNVAAYDITFSTLGGTLAEGYAGQLSNWYDYSDRNRVVFSGIEHFHVKLGALGDYLLTGDGDDQVSGNDGNDHLSTGKGTDIVDGGAGTSDRWEADKSFAAAGQDIDVDLTAVQQSLHLGTGSVRGIEALTLSTGAGNDDIVTLASFLSDVIRTGEGADFVKVAGGKDNVDLGAGTDRLVVDWSWVRDYGIEFSSLSGTLADGYSGVLMNWYDYSDRNRVDFAGVESFEVRLGSGHDVLYTGDGDDIVSGSAGNDFFSTGKGVDDVAGGDETDGSRGADRWVADKSAATAGMTIDLTIAGASTYRIGTSTGTVSGIEALGTGSTGGQFSSGSGADLIVTRGEFYADYILTNGGNDTVRIAGGKDLVYTGTGSDTLVIDWSSVTGYAFEISSLAEDADGYSGTICNWYDYSDRNRVDFTGIDRFDVRLGAGDDTLRTGMAADIVSAGAGNDTLDTGKGADQVEGGDGIDRWIADKADALGAVSVDLTKALQSVYMTSGRVTGIEALDLRTGAGADRIVTLGAFYNETLYTNAGADTVLVGGGKDYVDLGTGSDLLIIDWSNVTDYAFEVSSIGGTLADGYSGTLCDWYNYSTRNRVDFAGVERFDVRLGALGDVFTAGDGADVIRGGGGADRLDAGGGIDLLDLGDKSGAIVLALAGSAEAGVFVDGVREDTVFNFENVAAGSGHDSLTGDAAANALTGGAGDDRLDGGAGRDRLDGGAGRDTASYASSSALVSVNLALAGAQNTGGGSVDTLVSIENLEGSSYRDTLTGNASANVIDGGLGADRMTGGAGSDTYVVDNVGDVVIEATAGGTDTVQSAISHTLGAEVENLILTGSAALSGTGNGAANLITGNDGANRLDGKAGADRLTGAAGNDTYVVDNAGDKVIELAAGGTDGVQSAISWVLAANVENLTLTGTGTINGTGNTLANSLIGNAAANILDGGAGNDLLDGKAGADRMSGGTGNDNYVVDNISDKAIEAAGGGTDIVRSSVSYVLAGEVEHLTLTGVAAINATGNTLANTLTGNGAANILDGKGGADRMVGGAGDDSYRVDHAGDVVVEGTNQGADRVLASVSYTLGSPAQVETLATVSAAATTTIHLTGNGFANAIEGNAGANRLKGEGGADSLDALNGDDYLYGGLGNDMLKGGAGHDRFYFDTALSRTLNVDDILDFSSADDTIQLSRAVFGGIGANGVLAASAFHAGTAAADAGDRILYDAATGNIYYDADGAGGASAVLFAHVSASTVLTAGDFIAYGG